MKVKLLAFITAFALLMTLTGIVFADTTYDSDQSDDSGEGIEIINNITISTAEPFDDAVLPGVGAPTEASSTTPAPAEAETSEASVQLADDSSATTSPRVTADRANYYLRHDDEKYNTGTKEYILDLYLVSDEYITTGTVGIEFDSMLANDIDNDGDIAGCFTVDDDYFSIVRTLSNEKNYFVFTWKINPDASDYIGTGDGLHIGELKIKNVELDDSGAPKGWHTETFRTLDWYTTSESTDPTYTTVHDGDVCLNDEIYNSTTGWYQGMSLGKVNSSDDIDLDNPDWYEWIDIGFLFDVEGLPVRDDRVIEGTIKGYNKNVLPVVELLSSSGDSVGEDVIVPIDVVNNDDSYSWAYSITLGSEVQSGEYTFVVSKNVHLTYQEPLTVGDEKETYPINVELYCGDIGGGVDGEANVIGDEKIKQNDRTLLIQHLNRRIDPGDALAARCDLNGDGKVTLHDLNIMKKYYNKSYQ